MTNVQIVATIGPSSKEKETISQMIDAGMSLARLNFSWGTHDEHAHFVEMVRSHAHEKGIAVPILQDLSGPRIQEGQGHTFDADASVITVKDLYDLEFTALLQPEYVALSFVRSAEDLRQLRQLFADRGIHSKVIAKIERLEALQALDEIIVESDGIMIARGDLGDAVPIETLPFVTKEILAHCLMHQKPVIVATEMLTSMIIGSKPSRADVSDIAQAVLDGASATMLSNETAVGTFPVETIALMRKVVNEALVRAEHPSLLRF